MTNFDDNSKFDLEHNSKWPYIPDYPYRILIVGGSRKTNALLILINNQPDIDKIYLYAKDPYEKKYQYLINKREKVELDHFQMICKMFTKILKITIQERNVKY